MKTRLPIGALIAMGALVIPPSLSAAGRITATPVEEPTAEGFLSQHPQIARAVGLAVLSLDLTEAQWDEVEALWSRHRDVLHERMGLLRHERRRYEQIVEAPHLNILDLQATALAVAEARSALMVEMGLLRHDLRGILTPAQRAQVDAAKSELREAASIDPALN